MEKQKIFSVVIVDEQGFWDSKSDYVTSATSLNKAKKLLKNWLLFNNYLDDTDEFDDDLVGSIEIWEQELNELSDPKRISVDLNELMNK